ncbi:hypothetical protein QBC47DRAFT_400600 [Echria macrotheca]|uniref:Uncharacterized protein n=1 Tax=Echria macrotheca TaxID=438768 RepID=A0AAJ0FB39_9PEZI|nr:hypothetical protein QBC47DRAFT_400600 [Echria macrotheca]
MADGRGNQAAGTTDDKHNPRDGHYVYQAHPEPGYEWLVNHHRANLVQAVSCQRSSGHERLPIRDLHDGLRGFRVEFAELQRMKMRKLQIKLIQHAVYMAKNGEEPAEPKDWEKDLEEYIKAVRDYDYMAQFSGQKDSPFTASSENKVDHKILEEETYNAELTFEFLESLQPGGKMTVIPTGPWSPDDDPIWGKYYLTADKVKTRNWAFRVRGAATVVGGLYLPFFGIFATTLFVEDADFIAGLAPILVWLVSVITWSIVVVSKVSELKDIVSMVAGYAAVLGIVLNSFAAVRQAYLTPDPGATTAA